MDMLEPADLSEFFDGSPLDVAPMEVIEMTPEEDAMVSALVARAKEVMAAKAQLWASQRKREDQASSPSQKISIRLPKPLLNLLRNKAAQFGMPYQTFIKTVLQDAATRWECPKGAKSPLSPELLD